MTVDSSGNVWIAGQTDGAFTGYTNGGGQDAFFAKYSSTGSFTASTTTVKQLGNAGDDVIKCIKVDSSGGIFIAGQTSGNMYEANAGGTDIFIAKYNSSFGQSWVWQFGNASPAGGSNTGNDTVTDCALDSAGNFYVVGNTTGNFATNVIVGTADGYILKLDGGSGAPSDLNGGAAGIAYALGVVATATTINSIYIDGSDNVYVGGVVNGNLDVDGSGDTHHAAGDLYFLRVSSAFASPLDRILNNAGASAAGAETGGYVSADSSGNIYLAGVTNGATIAMTGAISDNQVGGDDAVIATWDSTGTPTQMLIDGTAAGNETVSGLAVRNSSVWVSGTTTDAFSGYTNAGGTDAYLARFNTSLAISSVHQLGSTGNDPLTKLVVDSNDYAFITGNASAVLPNSIQTTVGDQQWFIAKYNNSGSQQ